MVAFCHSHNSTGSSIHCLLPTHSMCLTFTHIQWHTHCTFCLLSFTTSPCSQTSCFVAPPPSSSPLNSHRIEVSDRTTHICSCPPWIRLDPLSQLSAASLKRIPFMTHHDLIEIYNKKKYFHPDISYERKGQKIITNLPLSSTTTPSLDFLFTLFHH